MKNPWTTKSSELKYENPWIKVTESQVLNPAGNPGIYGVVHFKNTAIAIIPLDENNNTWIVGQYRYTLNTYEWEVPEGGCPEGEDPLEAAKLYLKLLEYIVPKKASMELSGQLDQRIHQISINVNRTGSEPRD